MFEVRFSRFGGSFRALGGVFALRGYFFLARFFLLGSVFNFFLMKLSKTGDCRPAWSLQSSERRKHFGAGFCGKIPEIPAKKIVK